VKNWLIAIIVALVLLAGGGYYWYTQQNPSVISDPIDAIPPSAVLVMNYPNMNSLWDSFEEQDYYESIIPVEELSRYFRRNQMLDSIIRYDQDLGKSFDGSSIWSSYHVTASDSLQVLHVIQPSVSDLKILEKLNKALNPWGIMSDISLGERKGFKLVVAEPFFTLHVTVANGLVIMASTESLLEKAIAQLNRTDGLMKDNSFAKAVRSAGKNVDINIFINYKVAPDYLKRVLKPTLLYQNADISDFATWTELDATLRPDGISFNGFTYTADSAKQFLDLFLDQKPQPISFTNYLPANTASFVFYGLDDLISFTADYRTLLEGRGTLKALEASVDSVNNQYGIDLEQNLLAWMGNSYGACITEPQSTSFADDTYWVFEARSSGLAKKLLTDLSKILAEKNGLEAFFGTFNEVEIGQLRLEGILEEIFGDGYEDFANPFFMVVEDFVVFGASEEAMQRYLQYIQADRTLAKNLSFSRFTESLSSTFNIFTYNHLHRSKNVLNSYLNREASNVLKNNQKVLDKFESLGTQITTTGQSFYSNVYLNYNPNWNSEDESYWKAEMDAKAVIPPMFVKNHLSDEHEILVQDENNQLYLFNLVGQELFKRELPEPIESRPQQIDAFKNGKLQFIFNTKNYIYVLDRNGKDVDGFPIELDSPAETELSVIEYDGKRDYRLLIACKNKRIYNYGVDGKRTKGWKHNRGGDPTIHPFKHLVVRGKDYLITGESDGKVHLLDRRGKNRVKVKKYVPPSKNNHLQPFKSSESAFTGIYITNSEGLIHRIALSGDVQSMNLGKFSPEHIFLVADLDADGGPEFIFYDLNMLQVYNYKKEKVFEQRIDPSATKPQLVKLSSGKSGIGFCYSNSEQLVLFDDSGMMVKGFPLSGNSLFDIFISGNQTVITAAGNENSVLIQSLQ